ncbi:hypothetical protein AC1031_006607 [Aphanomyces cochlioides]|nr:hypothetical protein AC1031_006607 [Aphanomyces cochlioides]
MGHLLVAKNEISCRLWAIVVIRMKKSVHERFAIIRQGSPSGLVGGFVAKSNSAEAHRARLTKSVKMASNLARIFDDQLEIFERKFILLKSELDTLRHTVKTHMELVRAFGEDAAINPDAVR